MKIYTKTGDRGETSLLGGSRVAKYDLRIEAYGTVDELNSYLGLIRSSGVSEELHSKIIDIQSKLFTLGAQLATEPGNTKVKIPKLQEGDTGILEEDIDKMEKDLPVMKNFVLPGGHPLVAHCHIARCICRRAERICTQLNSESEVPDFILIFLNRLSDYLFVLSRKLSVDLSADEIPWRPRN